MLYFDAIEWTNFLSYGNAPTRYEFVAGISRIKGENGVGKSLISDAIWFALFGKCYRKITHGRMLNSINKKDLTVTLWLHDDHHTYRIERGLFPQYFKIYEDDELKELTSKTRSYQEMLETEILGFGEKIADQLLVKSLTRNVAFPPLSKGEKRAVVEGILGIEIFTTMNNIAGNKLAALDTEIKDVKKDVEKYKHLYENELLNVNNLRRMREKIEEEARQRAEATEDKIKQLQSEIDKYEVGLEKITEYRKMHDAASAEREEARTALKKQRDVVTSLKSKLSVLENKRKIFAETCPGCPKLDEVTSASDASKIREEVILGEAKVVELESNVSSINERIKKIDEIIYNENFLRSNIKKRRETIEDMVSAAASSAAETIVIDETKLREFVREGRALAERYNDLSSQKKHLALVKTLLADDGIKSYIIKRHLPSINKLLNTYLQKFNADILFYFDSEFNEVIGTRHKEDFTYYNFSEGQKRRIDLSIMFAFTEFGKIKNKKANTNLMLLDEITAGCDAAGENALYDILREVVRRESKEIVTISHSMALDPEKIDRAFEVKFDRGFSKLERIEE